MIGPAPPIDWPAIIGVVALTLLGSPNAALSNRCTLRYGRRGSLAVHTAGAYAGTFRDHEAGESGGVLALVQREHGGDRREAMAWLRARGILSGETVPARERSPQAVSTCCPDTPPASPDSAQIRRQGSCDSI